MQQLYKSRDFGALFQDTFAFVKANGGHLFKNFFAVNGIFLLILMVLGYFFTKFYSDVVFGGLINGNASAIDNYMNENAGLFIILVLIFVIVALIAGMISYAYLPIYLKLYEEHEGNHFGVNQLISAYKSNIGKLFIFLICGIILIIPTIIIAGLAAFVLTITIIGMLGLTTTPWRRERALSNDFDGIH